MNDLLHASTLFAIFALALVLYGALLAKTGDKEHRKRRDEAGGPYAPHDERREGMPKGANVNLPQRPGAYSPKKPMMAAMAASIFLGSWNRWSAPSMGTSSITLSSAKRTESSYGTTSSAVPCTMRMSSA